VLAEITLMKTLLALLIAVNATYYASAQNAPIQTKFEVASVKRADQCSLGRTIDPRSLTLRGMPLKPLLMQAFNVKLEQIEGPAWLESDCFDISARIPDGGSLDQLSAMLQGLLTERFKLSTHKEDRPSKGYALVVDKGGPKFKEDDPKVNFVAQGAPPGARIPPGSVLFGANGNGRLKGVMTMALLASNLARQGYGPVQDATGLTGKYDIDLTWTPDPAFRPTGLQPPASPMTPPAADIPTAPEGSSLFTALRESLGLRLERRDVPIQFLVVDHIERVPTEN
jgi:uncharacterized protein (TIGR03435 family)